jgi:hypothetical protein
MWAVMVRFGHKKLPDELNRLSVHCLENVITAIPDFHANFDSLMVWFIATVCPTQAFLISLI